MKKVRKRGHYMTGNSLIYTATVYKILFEQSHQTECDEWAT